MMYREVIKLKYNNKTFQMYIGPKNERFFLEILSSGYLSYPLLEDLINLEYIFANKDEYKYDIKDIGNIKEFVPKVIYKGVPIVLSTTMLLASCTHIKNTNYNQSNPTTIEDIQTDLGFTVADQSTPLEVDLYNHSDSKKYDYVYDIEYLDTIFGSSSGITEEMLYRIIDSNQNISSRFKPFIKEYCHLFITKYPKADLRVLYYNLIDLKVVECETKNELMEYTKSYDSYACYMRSENTIYTSKEYEYKKGTWEYQIIMHELSHVARTYCRDTDGDGLYEKNVKFDGPNLNQVSVAEAINSLFTVRMFDYEEKNIAYQLQSNYMSVILDSLDNYELSDYINHSLGYLASKIDEQTGYNNYASVIFELIDIQYKDYHNDNIQIDEVQYYPLYDFIAEMYFNKNIKHGMSKADMTLVCDDLVQKVTYGVNDNYHIDSNHFYVYLEDYIEKHGLGNHSR